MARTFGPAPSGIVRTGLAPAPGSQAGQDDFAIDMGLCARDPPIVVANERLLRSILVLALAAVPVVGVMVGATPHAPTPAAALVPDLGDAALAAATNRFKTAKSPRPSVTPRPSATAAPTATPTKPPTPPPTPGSQLE